MTHLESAAWPLACGGGSVFVTAAVLIHAPWQATLVILAVIVAAWSLRAPLVVSAALGGMAWLFLTGLGVDGAGELHLTGWSDAIRLSVLVSSGLVGMAVGRLFGDPAVSRPSPRMAVKASYARAHLAGDPLVPKDPTEESRDD
jgi:hypothetical protein